MQVFTLLANWYNKNNPNIRVIFIRSLMGCLEGIEPSITGPQPAVLPLHHRHHNLYVRPAGIEPT